MGRALGKGFRSLRFPGRPERDAMLRQINRLLSFALRRGLTPREDLQYAANRLLAACGEACFAFEEMEEDLCSPAPILDEILDLMAEKAAFEDTPANRDLFDTLLMDCLTPRPAEVARRFKELYAESPEAATGYFYDLSVNSNYIRKTRTDKNIFWPYQSPYGRLEITINVSKPEKDPRDIASALAQPSSGYPTCLLCRENEGFAGNQSHPARQNLRLAPLPESVSNGYDGSVSEWFMQYSPYIYYNEHCIFLNSLHIPMRIDRTTLGRLLSILDFLPHYFAGSNADLPIVGGSILTHDHYQGGRHAMPIEAAQAERAIGLKGYGSVSVARVKWPLSTLRLAGPDKLEMASLANKILLFWRGYDDPRLDIISKTGSVPHSTVTPVARRRNNLYELDLVLRNNRKSEKYPFGIFHPHEALHHIKRENIGLIEAMGLAILPARLLNELADIEKALSEGREALGGSGLHDEWYLELRRALEPGADIHQKVRDAVGAKFLRCLLDAGVFKRDKAGLEGFDRFIDAFSASMGK